MSRLIDADDLIEYIKIWDIPCDWSLNEEGEINETEKGNTD